MTNEEQVSSLLRRVVRAMTSTTIATLMAGAAHAADTAMVDNPCPPPLVPPVAVVAGLDQLLAVEPSAAPLPPSAEVDDYWRELKLRRAKDWADLCHYREENAALATRTKVVFIGASIVEFWKTADPALFGPGVVDRGISGQTSAQLLLRFSADVVALRPKLVQILVGSNDIAGNTGPMRVEDYRNNIRAMVAIAKANRIRVALASITPSARFGHRPEMRPAQQIRELNAWLKSFAKESGSAYVDYYAVLTDEAGGLKAGLSNDQLHPNRRGYELMRPLAEKVIASAR